MMLSFHQGRLYEITDVEEERRYVSDNLSRLLRAYNRVPGHCKLIRSSIYYALAKAQAGGKGGPYKCNKRRLTVRQGTADELGVDDSSPDGVLGV